ncbi:MAG: hypothetical protein ABJB01_12655 [Rudaea sp.]
MLTYVAVSIVVSIVVGALILMAATRIAVGFFPRFAHAIFATSTVAILALVILWMIAATLGMMASSALLLTAATFAVNAVMVDLLIRRSDGSRIGFAKACVVTTIQLAIDIVIVFTIALMAGATILEFVGKLH